MAPLLWFTGVIMLIIGGSWAANYGKEVGFIWLSGIVGCICIRAAIRINNREEKLEEKQDTSETAEKEAP